MRKLLNFIGGEFREPAGGKFLKSFNPATGLPHLEVSDSDARDIASAVGAAKTAFADWSQTSDAERAAFLLRIAERIEARIDEFAEAESADQGKPIWLARQMDITRVIHNFRFFAGTILHQSERATRTDAASLNYVTRHPLGVAGLISPWNLPLYLLTWKIAPAIAFGNTVVCKPSEYTSFTAALLAEVCSEAELPSGVVNIVFGTGPQAGAALVSHPDVPLLSFTGGTATGRAIAVAAAPMLKKLSLELGGKNPNIVFEDCDLEQAVKGSVSASFLNQGEICLCGSRLYVQKKIYPEFLKRFLEEVKALKVGDPSDAATFLGPVVSKEHLEKIHSFLKIAQDEGVKVLTGGKAPKLSEKIKDGYFLEPTVLEAPKHGSRLQQEEIFGPVVTISPFETEDEVIQLANGVSYGLSASLWTQNLKRAHRVAEKLEAGTVWVNTWMQRDLRMPFGGVKASGMGREGQDESREFFTEAKTICIRHGE